MKIINFGENVISISAKHLFQVKLPFSFCSNLIFRPWILVSFWTHYIFGSKWYFGFWNISIFKAKCNVHYWQTLFLNCKAIYKTSEPKFCFALSLLISFQQKNSFYSSKTQLFYPTKTWFSACQGQYPKTFGQATCSDDTFTLL